MPQAPCYVFSFVDYHLWRFSIKRRKTKREKLRLIRTKELYTYGASETKLWIKTSKLTECQQQS